MSLIEIVVRFGGKKVYHGKWDSMDDLMKERVPFLFAEHIAKRLEAKE
jgi:hypothetical protein